MPLLDIIRPTWDLEGATVKQRARVILAEKFGIGPFFTRTAVWGELIDKANFGQPAPNHPTPIQMAELLDKVFQAPDDETRYSLLAEPVPNSNEGEIWFDYIEGLTSHDIIKGIAKVAGGMLPEGGIYRRAVDMGSGSGEMGATLAGLNGSDAIAQKVTLVDKSNAMLAIARRKYGEKMDYLSADVLHTALPAASSDLVVSSGLVYMLGVELQDDYFREISRVLKEGGVYIDGDYINPNYRIKATGARAARVSLAWLIKGSVSGKEILGNPIAGEDQVKFFQKFGLAYSEMDYVDSETAHQISIRILRKHPTYY